MAAAKRAASKKQTKKSAAKKSIDEEEIREFEESIADLTPYQQNKARILFGLPQKKIEAPPKYRYERDGSVTIFYLTGCMGEPRALNVHAYRIAESLRYGVKLVILNEKEESLGVVILHGDDMKSVLNAIFDAAF